MVKVKRSMPAPESLKIESRKHSGSYKERDVIDRLERDFNGKCYICGIKPISDPQVEHLRPHKGGRYPDRKFDWNNLFLVCPHCNNVKNQEKYDDNVIDCCSKDPEDMIVFTYEKEGVHAVAINQNDYEAVNTSALIEEVFNKKNTGIRVYASKVRMDGLAKEMKTLFLLLRDYKKSGDANDEHLIRMLSATLSRKSAYAAFKRCYVRQHSDEYAGLQRLLA